MWYEAGVLVDHTKELLQLTLSGWQREFEDCLALGFQRGDASFRDSVSEEVNAWHAELRFVEVDLNAMFSQSSKYLLEMVLVRLDVR